MNNAGFGLSSAFLSHDREQKQAEIEVNVQAFVVLTHHFREAMAARGQRRHYQCCLERQLPACPLYGKAGFADCIDTHESFRRQLTKLRELRIIL